MESLVNDSGSGNTAVVDQILILYDNFYQMYVFKVTSQLYSYLQCNSVQIVFAH